MSDDRQYRRYEPPFWRLAIAFILAPIPPIVVFALFWRGDLEGSPGFVDGLFAGGLGAYPTILIFGVPLLLMARRRVRPTMMNVVLSGALVASLPWWIMALLSASASTIRELALPAMLLGLLGGLAFYIVGVYRPAPYKRS